MVIIADDSHQFDSLWRLEIPELALCENHRVKTKVAVLFLGECGI
jgi:hypothetical protein